MRFLIVNADDFGLTERVSAGILEAMGRGIVTSASAMVCTVPGKELLRRAPELSGRAGIHLQLTGGEPCSPRHSVPSLLAEDGAFPSRRAGLRGPVTEEVHAEWRAQVAAFRGCGLEPTHIDTHQHVHKDPAVLAAYCRIALENGLPARSCDPLMSRVLRTAGIACMDGFECTWTGASCTVDHLLACVDAAFDACGPDGWVELICHPGYYDAGYYDAGLTGASAMTDSRRRELTALCDPGLPEQLAGRGISLANWSILKRTEHAV